MAAPDSDELVYHFELKQGFNVIRQFNLSRPDLERLILVPWSQRNDIELDDKLWIPSRCKLKVLRGPLLEDRDRGLGRGWTTAQRAGEDVTDEMLGATTAAGTTAAARGGDPAVEAFKDDVVTSCTGQPVALASVATMAAERNPRARVSEVLALAERAVWELLHQERIALFTPDDLGAAAKNRWQPVLLAWKSWSGPDSQGISIEALPAA
jgi:hypothetical protein